LKLATYFRATFRSICPIVAVAVWISFIPFGNCSAQQVPAAVQSPIESTTDLVKVDVSVVDKKGNFVSGLEENNFRVQDNGVERSKELFTSVEVPVQVLLLIETSPAVYLIRNEHILGAHALLDGLASDDQVGLVTYAQSVRSVQAFTADKSELLAALDGIQYNVGMAELNFYESVSHVLDSLVPLPGKKAIVLLTTGLDSSSTDQWNPLVRKLRGNDVVIFPIALGGSLRSAGAKKPKTVKAVKRGDRGNGEYLPGPANPVTFAKADAALLSLAKLTGGRAYFPRTAEDFAPIYKEIASALRHQYVIGISPVRDGEFHTLEVQVVERKAASFRVFAREGYLAPKD
jgi:VWFA-related protein